MHSESPLSLSGDCRTKEIKSTKHKPKPLVKLIVHPLTVHSKSSPFSKIASSIKLCQRSKLCPRTDSFSSKLWPFGELCQWSKLRRHSELCSQYLFVPNGYTLWRHCCELFLISWRPHNGGQFQTWPFLIGKCSYCHIGFNIAAKREWIKDNLGFYYHIYIHCTWLLWHLSQFIFSYKGYGSQSNTRVL